MGMVPLFLVLMVSGTIFLSWNDIQRKKYLDLGIDERYLMIFTFVMEGVILCIPLLYVGIPVVKSSFWPAAVGTVVVNVIAQQFYFWSYKYSDASLVAPLRLVTAPLVVVTGFFVLGETVSILGMLGIMATVAGLWFLLFPKMRPTFRVDTGVAYGLIAAVLFAISFPLDKQTVISSSALFASAVLFPSVGVLLLVLNLVRDRSFLVGFSTTIRKQFLALLFMSSTLAVGTFLTNQALNYSLAAYAANLKRVQAVWTIIFSGAFLREKHITQRLLATLVMLFGIILSLAFR